MASTVLPRGFAILDNQGEETGLCARLATSKAISNGFMEKEFVPGKELDFVQGEIKSALVNEHKNMEGNWPTDFDGKSFHLQENKTKMWWDIAVKVEEILQKMQHDELKKNMEFFEHVLVYKPGVLHSVYVDKYNPNNKMVTCINSFGGFNPNPRVELKDVVKLYRISCTAEIVKKKKKDSGKVGGVNVDVEDGLRVESTSNNRINLETSGQSRTAEPILDLRGNANAVEARIESLTKEKNILTDKLKAETEQRGKAEKQKSKLESKIFELEIVNDLLVTKIKDLKEKALKDTEVNKKLLINNQRLKEQLEEEVEHYPQNRRRSSWPGSFSSTSSLLTNPNQTRYHHRNRPQLFSKCTLL